MIALPPTEWQFLSTMTLSTFVEFLKQWAAQVDLKRFASSPRSPKKTPPQRQLQPHRPHVSTARLLTEKQRAHKASTSEQPPSDVVETPATQTLQS